MKLPEWKDVSSWNRDDSAEARKEPRAVEVKLPSGARLVASRRHQLDGWYSALYSFDWDTGSLGSPTLEEAKRETLADLEAALSSDLEAVRALLGRKS